METHENSDGSAEPLFSEWFVQPSAFPQPRGPQFRRTQEALIRFTTKLDKRPKDTRSKLCLEGFASRRVAQPGEVQMYGSLRELERIFRPK